jgi:hypothetical protein
MNEHSDVVTHKYKRHPEMIPLHFRKTEDEIEV